MSIKRRDFLAGSAGVASMIWTPKGIGPFDPRQPKRVLDPRPPSLPPKREIYTRQPAASPVHLSSSLVLRSGANGTVPASALKNPMGQDMELLEIKFEISGDLTAGAAIFGGTVWCELTMGGVKITNGAIPVWSFGRAENLDGELKSDSVNTLAFASYSWRLPRPLFIPAGAVVTPNFTHTGFVPSALNVRIGYSARTVFTKPKVIYMPWVAAYVSKSFNPITAADSDLSAETDLVNIHPEKLHLQRFVGRTLFRGDSSGTALYGESIPELSRYLVARVTDSYGRPIVRSYTPFRTIFGALTRSWEMDNGAELDPEAYYLVNLRKDAFTLSAGVTGAAQAFISMVGWRELEAR